MQGRAGCLGSGKKLFTPSPSITTTSPFSMSRMNFAPMMSSAQVSEQRIGLPSNSPSTSGPDAERIARADKLLVGQRDQRVGALDLGQRLDETVDDLRPARARREQEHDFGIGGRLADRPAANELPPQREPIGQIAVMGDREAAGLEFGEQRLDIAQHGLAGGGIADVADRGTPRQAVDGRGLGEVIADQPLAALRMEPGAVESDDAGGLLAAMLQRMQPERDDRGGIGVIENAEDAALLAQPVLAEVEAGVARRIGGGLPPALLPRRRSERGVFVDQGVEFLLVHRGTARPRG